MQRKHLGKALHFLVAVCALVSALTLFACGGGDDEGEVKNVVATVAADDDTVPAVQSRTIRIDNGQVFGANVGSNPIDLTFNTPRSFTITRPTALPPLPPLTGTVSYGSDASCTFTAATGGALDVDTCNLIVNASNVVVGTGQVSGTISLVLNNGSGITITSQALPATVFINGDGELFVVNPATNVSVDMGIEP
jgi:hypothetical protein